jgi:hypothetical protein
VNTICLLMLVLMAPGEESPPRAKSLQEQLSQENLADARQWQMYLDAGRQKKAELIERPVYLWTNPTKNGGQYGSVFVWVHQGRPMVVGSIFAHPSGGRRRLVHEFHSLAPTKLSAECQDGGEVWEPKSAIALQPLADAPIPESTAGKRLIQIRSLGRQFGGHTVDWRKQRWELRLLPQPLFRYDQPQGDAIDGALLALVTDAGTDPEVLLLLEARKAGWHYALFRFSDSSLYVRRGEKEIWSAVRGVDEQQEFNADHTYQVYNKRLLEGPLGAADEAQR